MLLCLVRPWEINDVRSRTLMSVKPKLPCPKQEAEGSAWHDFPYRTFRPPESEESILWHTFEHARSSPSTNTGLRTTLESRSSTGILPLTGAASASHCRPLGEGRSSSDARATCWPWRGCYWCGVLREGASDGDSKIFFLSDSLKVYAFKVVTVTQRVILFRNA